MINAKNQSNGQKPTKQMKFLIKDTINLDEEDRLLRNHMFWAIF